MQSGRLGPGEMLVVDLKSYEVLEPARFLLRCSTARCEYETLVADTPLTDAAALEDRPAPRSACWNCSGSSAIPAKMCAWCCSRWQWRARTPSGPWATTRRSPRWRARRGRSTTIFRQRFAQVTNPPIDPLREACVVQLHTRLGPWPHLLDQQARIPGCRSSSPFLSLGQMEALRKRSHPLADEMPPRCWMCLLAQQTLSAAIDGLCAEAIELVRGGAQFCCSPIMHCAGQEKLPMPMALATGAVHHALIDAGVRTPRRPCCGSGRLPRPASRCCALGYGAGAVCPWLALRDRCGRRSGKGRSEHAASLRRGSGEDHVEDGHLGGGQLSRRASLRLHRAE